MKLSIFLAIFMLCLSATTALAQEPCPTAPAEAPKVADPNEKCKPELGETAPVLFVFPDENKAPEQNAKADDTPNQPDSAANNTEKKSL